MNQEEANLIAVRLNLMNITMGETKKIADAILAATTQAAAVTVERCIFEFNVWEAIDLAGPELFVEKLRSISPNPKETSRE